MPSTIEARVQKAIAEKTFPGCVVGIVRKDGERTVLPFGHFTYELDSPKVAEDTIYDLASITKSIPTASLALTLLRKGKFDLSNPVKKFIPELQNDYGVTVEHLLKYAVHGVQMSTLKDKSPEEISKYIFAHGFDAPPGESQYTNLPAFLLGMIVERVSGISLEQFAHERFFEPLQMHRTTFFPSKSDCAPTEIDERGEVRGLPHDESAYVFAKEGRAVGHAGLFSTTPDMLNFLEALLQGKYPYVTDGAQKGLGWQLRDQMSMGKFAGIHTFGKTGFTGTSVLVDIDRGIAFVILSNRTYPKRPADTTTINEFRADITGIILS